MISRIFKKLSNRKNLKKIFYNFNWLTVEKAIKILLGITIGAWVARYLGPEDYGNLNYARSFVSLFAFLSTVGLNQIVVREVVKSEGDKNEILGTTFLLKIIGSVVLNITAVGLIFFLNPGDATIQLFVFIVAFGYLFKPFDSIAYWFRSQVKSKYAVIPRTISYLLVNGLKAALILLNAPLVAFVSVVAINFGLNGLLLLVSYQYITKDTIFNWKPRLTRAKSLLRDSWPLILSGAAVAIHMKVDQVMIGNMINSTQLGIYAAAARLKKWSFIAVAISNSTFPALLKAREKSKDLYHGRLQRLLSILTWMAIILTVVIIFLSPFIIKILYGSQYAQSSLILAILSGVILFNFSGIVSSKYLIAENHTKINFYRTLLGVSTNLLLNFILIPLMGIVGSAISTLLSVAVQDYFGVVLFSESRRLFFMYLKALNPKKAFREAQSLFK